jgi:ankyrin repeat protein
MKWNEDSNFIAQKTEFEHTLRILKNTEAVEKKKKLVELAGRRLLQLVEKASTSEYKDWLNENNAWINQNFQVIQNIRISIGLERSAEIDRKLDAHVPAGNQLPFLNIEEIIIEFINRKDKNHETWVKLGDIINQQGLEAAIASYLIALKLSPDNVSILVKLGDTYYAMERYKESYVRYQQAYRLRKDDKSIVEKLKKAESGCIDLLMEGCRTGDIDIVKEILKINIKPKRALIVAAESNQLDIVKLLLEEENYDPNYTDGSGWNAVHWAASEDSLSVVKYFLEKQRFTCNAVTNKGMNNGADTLLIITLRYKAIKCAELLINKKFQIDKKDQSGWAPIRWAYYKQLYQLLNVLINNGADINSKANDGTTILHCATKDENVEVVKTILSQEEVNPDIQDDSGKTPLHIAAYEASDGRINYGSDKSQKIVKLLVQHGADPYLKDSGNNQPIDNREPTPTIIKEAQAEQHKHLNLNPSRR